MKGRKARPRFLERGLEDAKKISKNAGLILLILNDKLDVSRFVQYCDDKKRPKIKKGLGINFNSAALSLGVLRILDERVVPLTKDLCSLLQAEEWSVMYVLGVLTALHLVKMPTKVGEAFAISDLGKRLLRTIDDIS